jgi:hypothetical protein
LFDETREPADEVRLVVERALGVGAMAGAKVFSALGDAAAFAAGFVDVLALVNHGFSSAQKGKAQPAG